MKIDELLEKFEELREHEYQKGNTEGAAAYSHCRQLLETNRTALEAGMRGVLRFQINYQAGVEHPFSVSLLGIDGEQVNWKNFVTRCSTKEQASETAISWAESLSLPYEFEEPTDDK